MTKPAPGTITWHDLTIPDAESLSDFYSGVVGWMAESVEMEGYDDYSMLLPDASEPAAGICHSRGVNADLPPQWLIYITVANLDQSMARCLELGGKIVSPERPLGSGRMCVIQDPAGAVSALFEPGDE